MNSEADIARINRMQSEAYHALKIARIKSSLKSAIALMNDARASIPDDMPELHKPILHALSMARHLLDQIDGETGE